MMYLQHFHLSEAPFGITPHTAFFYPGSERGAILDALIYAAQHEEGIVKVTGEVGTGKSMLCRKLMESLPQQIVSIYLANPSLGRDEILAAIAEDLVPGFSADGQRSSQLIRRLQSILVDLYAEGKRVLLLVDEAHAMPAESLEEIRLLSNLESNRHKLLHIVLFGQQELDELLTKHAMRPLQERITQRFWLKPLSAIDIGQYLYFRLKSARYQGPELFSPEAIELMAAYSHGLARRVNILADKALLAAYTLGESRIEARHVKQAIADAGYQRGSVFAKRTRLGKTGLGLGLGLALVCSVAAVLFFFRAYLPDPMSTSVALQTPQAPQAPVTAQDSDRRDAETTVGVAAAVSLPPSPSRTTQPRPDPDKVRQAAFARGTTWLAENSAPGYSIQLAIVLNEPGRQQDLANWIQSVAPEVGTLSTQHPLMLFDFGTNTLSVLYGQYESREAARAAYLGLPAAFRPQRFQVRTKRGILENLNAAVSQ